MSIPNQNDLNFRTEYFLCWAVWHIDKKCRAVLDGYIFLAALVNSMNFNL